MSDAPDFDDVVTSDEAPSTSSSERTGGTKGQAFVKGKYGTTMYQASDGCDDCHRNAHVAIKVDRAGEGSRGATHDVVLACQEHMGDHTEGLIRAGIGFELIGFD